MKDIKSFVKQEGYELIAVGRRNVGSAGEK
jgi:hypothetical protein